MCVCFIIDLSFCSVYNGALYWSSSHVANHGQHCDDGGPPQGCHARACSEPDFWAALARRDSPLLGGAGRAIHPLTSDWKDATVPILEGFLVIRGRPRIIHLPVALSLVPYEIEEPRAHTILPSRELVRGRASITHLQHHSELFFSPPFPVLKWLSSPSRDL